MSSMQIGYNPMDNLLSIELRGSPEGNTRAKGEKLEVVTCALRNMIITLAGKDAKEDKKYVRCFSWHWCQSRWPSEGVVCNVTLWEPLTLRFYGYESQLQKHLYYWDSCRKNYFCYRDSEAFLSSPLFIFAPTETIYCRTMTQNSALYWH